jgi:hypothetical protein
MYKLEDSAVQKLDLEISFRKIRTGFLPCILNIPPSSQLEVIAASEHHKTNSTKPT